MTALASHYYYYYYYYYQPLPIISHLKLQAVVN